LGHGCVEAGYQDGAENQQDPIFMVLSLVIWGDRRADFVDASYTGTRGIPDKVAVIAERRSHSRPVCRRQAQEALAR
jgi:hypothetical protein